MVISLFIHKIAQCFIYIWICNVRLQCAFDDNLKHLFFVFIITLFIEFKAFVCFWCCCYNFSSSKDIFSNLFPLLFSCILVLGSRFLLAVWATWITSVGKSIEAKVSSLLYLWAYICDYSTSSLDLYCNDSFQDQYAYIFFSFIKALVLVLVTNPFRVLVLFFFISGFPFNHEHILHSWVVYSILHFSK